MITIRSAFRLCAALTLGVAALTGCTQSKALAPTPTPTLPTNARQVGSCLELSSAAYRDAVHLTLPPGFESTNPGTSDGVVTGKDLRTADQQLIAITESAFRDTTPEARLKNAWIRFEGDTRNGPGPSSPWQVVLGGRQSTSTMRFGDNVPPTPIGWYVVPTANSAFVVMVAGSTTDQALAAVGPSIATGHCPG